VAKRALAVAWLPGMARQGTGEGSSHRRRRPNRLGPSAQAEWHEVGHIREVRGPVRCCRRGTQTFDVSRSVLRTSIGTATISDKVLARLTLTGTTTEWFAHRKRRGPNVARIGWSQFETTNDFSCLSGCRTRVISAMLFHNRSSSTTFICSQHSSKSSGVRRGWWYFVSVAIVSSAFVYSTYCLAGDTISRASHQSLTIGSDHSLSPTQFISDPVEQTAATSSYAGASQKDWT
jgi:hypothetical protein